ncbi:Zinc finger protein 862 [Acropora cervicornis]|uniref:Zinc finger protein 862 n=1 Tax=Acropora cervicornis TaxID=6130 RepID=A0AAD9V7F3_ACRCE|nr:Zinc finger protein 862 [Acropora cervicornis]
MLQVKNGITLGETYLNDKRCREFIEAIAEIMELEARDAMNNSQPRFFSLMGDGGTDSSNKDLEIIYFRMLCNGEPVNKYLKIVELPNGTADGVIASFDQALFKVGVNDWRNGLVSMGSDGASVYTGVQNGVVAKLKQSVPWLLGIHCIAHNLELAILDCIKDEILLSSLRDMLQSVNKHYHYSPKALRELRELAEVMGEKIQKPGNLKGTRWVPHLHRALKVFLKNYTVIHSHFQNTVAAATSSADMQGRARKIIKEQEKFNTVLFACFILDVLECLSKLSMLFQKDNVTLTLAKDGLEHTTLKLTALLARPGPYLQQFLQNTGDKNILSKGSIQVTDPTLHALLVFDTSLWPDDRAELATYGEDKIHHLVQHFRPLLQRNNFDFEAVHDEWGGLKVCISNNFLDLNLTALWKRVFTNYIDRFCNILMLVEILLILPLSTACCERGFSRMGKIKSDWRSCLWIYYTA